MFSYDRHGRQVGLDWERLGLPNPERPMVTDVNGDPVSKQGSYSLAAKRNVAVSRRRGQVRGGAAYARKVREAAR